MRLTARLVLIIMLPVTLITAGYGYLTIQREERRLQELMRDEARTLGHLLREEVVLQWRQAGQEGVTEFVQRTTISYGEVKLRWVRPGAPPGGQGPDAGRLPPNSDAPQLTLDDVFSSVERDEQGQAHLRTYYPVPIDDQQPGYLEFTESLEEVERHKRERWYQLLALLGAFLACGGFVTLIGVRLVGRPLEQLIDKTERIGAGDFSRPLELRGHAELSRLADSLNRMCRQLEESQRNIRAESAARLAAVEQLRHADRLKTVGRLASGVAHELGTPLNVVGGRAELIASGQLPPADVTLSAQAIKREVDRMAAIVRQLLDFARRGSPRRQDADLGEIVRDSLKLLQPLAQRHDIQLTVHGDEQPMKVRVDAGQIQQVVTNLVDNAIQAQPGGGNVDVRLAETRRGRPPGSGGLETERPAEREPAGDAATPQPFYTISVEDQGTGIEAEHREHLFEPFFTTKDVGEGTGLGLSVSFGIVQDHGGWIDVVSEPGRGSRFTVYLPREQ